MAIDQRTLAEQYLDEMINAEAAWDYQAFVQRFEQADLDNFDEARFKEEVQSIQEELGAYKTREYFGCLQGGVGHTRQLNPLTL